ncbi:MAG TPA: CheR family methyltransferase [Opitutaceae bacterium]|nr:CheR family methyltransferase [Opitutaceae bacterium]
MPDKPKKSIGSASAFLASSAGSSPRAPSFFPVVGVGASAGGVEAVSELLRHLPPNPGIALVVVMHLDPNGDGDLPGVFALATDMVVAPARQNAPIERNHVYVMAPDRLLGLKSGRRFSVVPRVGGKAGRMPIDRFFRSLAEHEGRRAVGVVLSGNGSDGALGVTAIKNAGGMSYAQSERSAKFASMPAEAAASGCVDFVLAPAEIATELARLGQARPEKKPRETPGASEAAFGEILMLLRRSTAVDFTHYKHATLRRRIERRMMLRKLDSLREYHAYLRGHAAEAHELFNGILISVTGFFRDPVVFQVLKRKIFPRLLRTKAPGDGIRIWIPGCSTGEEVYSLAIVLNEINAERSQRPIQIFGTDINEGALERARAGFFPERIQQEVDAERLRRYFARSDGGYRVNKTIRDMCIFARQNLTVDPPFSNLDLISCRNVLIYLGPELQRKVMPVFHYALRPNGLLMLGVSETVGRYADLFALMDKKAKVYVKKAVRTPPSVAFINSLPTPPAGGAQESAARPHLEAPPPLPEIQKQADRIILSGFGPAGVTINRHFEVLQFRGRTGPFLEHPHGEASLDLFKMAQEGLLLDLRAVVNRSIKQNARARQERIRVRQNGHFLECSVEVVPFSVPPGTERFYLILFEAAAPVAPVELPPPARGGKERSARSREAAQIAHLDDELGSMRESMQAVIDEQEATNEELRSANEEITSSNEELQSTNEELETAKEELQSTNEELTTLNDELESRNAELQQVNNDLHNLLASVSIPVIILNSDLRIRRFTAAAEKMFKFIPTDIGRPITDINAPLEIPRLAKQVLEVLDTLAPKDLEIQDRSGHRWSVRIRAYKTMENKIDGVVMALVDIDGVKDASRPRP